MAKDLTISLENRPGTLADAFEALGRAGINVEGGCGLAIDGSGVLHVLVEDAEGARRALEQAGLQIQDERDVVLVEVENRPGEGGELFRRIAGAGVNVEAMYTTLGNRVAIAADLDRARQALGTEFRMDVHSGTTDFPTA